MPESILSRARPRMVGFRISQICFFYDEKYFFDLNPNIASASMPDSVLSRARPRMVGFRISQICFFSDEKLGVRVFFRAESVVGSLRAGSAPTFLGTPFLSILGDQKLVNFGAFFGTKNGKVFSILGDQFSADLGDFEKMFWDFFG